MNRIYPLSARTMVRAACIASLVGLGGCTFSLEGLRAVFGAPGRSDTMDTAAAAERAKRHFAAGQFGLAIDSFGAVVETDQTSVTALNGLAASYDRIGRHELAGRFYRQALWLDPKSSQTLNNIGYSYYLQGKLDLALAYLGEALVVAETDPVINANRRLTLTALGANGPVIRRAPIATAASIHQTALSAPRPARVIQIERSTRLIQTLRSRPDLPAGDAILKLLRPGRGMQKGTGARSVVMRTDSSAMASPGPDGRRPLDAGERKPVAGPPHATSPGGTTR